MEMQTRGKAQEGPGNSRDNANPEDVFVIDIDTVNRIGLYFKHDAEAANNFVYDGFDPKLIFSLLLSKVKTLDEFKTDLGHMATLFVIRGNNIDKIKNSTRQEGKVIIEALIQKYGLISRLSKQDRRNSLTLSRVCMTVPGFALSAMKAFHREKVPLQCTELGKLHCLLRVSCAMAYFTESFCPHVY